MVGGAIADPAPTCRVRGSTSPCPPPLRTERDCFQSLRSSLRTINSRSQVLNPLPSGSFAPMSAANAAWTLSFTSVQFLYFDLSFRDQLEVSRLSAQGIHPYLCHYSTAFAFSSILSPLGGSASFTVCLLLSSERRTHWVYRVPRV